MNIIGLSKLNLEPEQAAYMQECLDSGRSWFVIRKRGRARCIQASGETRERVSRCLKGWPGSTLVQIVNGKVFWHNEN